jgi:predicted ribosome quality control (RQC) complex YloA/Tae2 family protein
MPFDSLTMAAVSDDVRARAVGGRIQKIIQPSLEAVALSVYRDGARHWLLLSADPRHARVALTDDRLAKGFAAPSPFVMLLRKYLDGARLLDVTHMPHERILVLTAPNARLIAEVMGKHSNVILVGHDDRILGAVKMVPPRLSRVRPIVTGHRYEPPPARSRSPDLYPAGPPVDPYQDPESFAELLRSADLNTPVRDALLGLLPGAGPFLVEQIALRAGVDATHSLAETSAAALLQASYSVFKLLVTREWEPVTFQDRRGRADFAAFVPLGVEDIEPAPSISHAIERAAGATESRDVLGTVRNAVRDQVVRARRGAERRVASLSEGLAAAQNAEEIMQVGQLVLAYQYLLEPGAKELVIPELETVIPLAPLLTPSENAERLFRRYRKLRDARERIPALLDAARADVEHLHDLESFIALADTEVDLRVIEREISAEPQSAALKSKPGRRSGPRRYTRGEFTAIVGRSARENEEVTFRLASRDDRWLHARERTGAHVILRGPRDAPVDVLESAAALAAYFSEGRTDTAVDVDIAAVRDVRKIPGAAPGRVTYRNFRTVRVQPSTGEWKPA